VAELLLRLRHNAHPIVLAATRRHVGLGVFPAACYMNHSCAPNVVHHFVDAGRTVVFRALRDIAAGEEVVYRYVETHQPRAERRRLLREAFFFDCACARCAAPMEREAAAQTRSPAAALGRADRILVAGAGPTEARAPSGAVRGAEAALRRGLALLAQGDSTAALRCLVEADGSPAMRALHRCHFLRHCTALALVAAGAGVADAACQAKYALRALQAMEEVAPVGTPELALLYGAHGQGLMRMLRTRVRERRGGERLPVPGGIEGATRQAVGALTSALRIRAVCFGEDHPCVASSRRLVEAAEMEAKGLVASARRG
jgi:hypothetical protein